MSNTISIMPGSLDHVSHNNHPPSPTSQMTIYRPHKPLPDCHNPFSLHASERHPQNIINEQYRATNSHTVVHETMSQPPPLHKNAITAQRTQHLRNGIAGIEAPWVSRAAVQGDDS